MTNTSIDDEYWMRKALAQACRAYEVGEVPVGAVLIDEGQQLVARAHNQTIQQIDPTAHAEVLAIRAGALIKNNYRLPGATLYCTLEPCAMCAGALIQARISRIVFAAFDQRSGAACSVIQLLDHPQLNHRVRISSNVLADESIALLQKFFQERRIRR